MYEGNIIDYIGSVYAAYLRLRSLASSASSPNANVTNPNATCIGVNTFYTF